MGFRGESPRGPEVVDPARGWLPWSENRVKGPQVPKNHPAEPLPSRRS